jgi:hypothetical protein
MVKLMISLKLASAGADPAPPKKFPLLSHFLLISRISPLYRALFPLLYINYLLVRRTYPSNQIDAPK